MSIANQNNSPQTCPNLKCSNNYLCRTEGCRKNLQIELLERLDHFVTLSTPCPLYHSFDAKDQQQENSFSNFVDIKQIKQVNFNIIEDGKYISHNFY